ncbi:MAG: PKD domain-containing protein [Chitinophagaceae bacterium]|nr:PKD domain-containing protein [Chitinophagaceae bacterium]
MPARAQAPAANFVGEPQANCSPVIVNFFDLSTGNPTSWYWDFGNGNSSTLQNPIATYFSPGTYTVSLTATNAAGSNTIIKTQYITVYEAPVPDFSANVRSGCFPLRVQYSDISTAGAGSNNVSWYWDFGNGVTSTLQNPLAIYNTAGTFTVTLRITNDKGCSKIITRPNYITVTPGVDAAFTNTQATVCSAPATINFTDNSTGPPTLTYLWDFGDGNTSTLQNPTHTYTANGTFAAKLVTLSSAGCQDTALSQPIIIGGIVTNFNAPAEACINEPVAFTNTSIPIPVSTIWSFGDGGTANTLNASHTYNTTGVYTIRMFNTYSNCIDSSIRSITINPRPVADFTAPVTTRCEPDLTVNFQDISTGGAIGWHWDFGDGGTSNTQNPSHTYTGYGAFNVTLIVTNSFGCTDTLVRNNYIRIQRASISIPQLPARGCIPHTINFAPVITSLDIVTSYQWDFGDGGTSALPNPVYTYITQGTYTVRLIITTSSGCTDTLLLPQAVRVGTKPVADFSAVPIPVCGRQPVYFTDLSVPADEWYWAFGDGSSSALQNPTHSYNDTGYFNVTLIATNNGCPDTIIKNNYTRVLPPIARFTVTPDCSNRLQFTFTNTSIVNPLLLPLTWEWDFGDGSPVSTAQHPVHLYSALGVYNVRLIVTNGSCADTTFGTVRAVNENPDFNADRIVACKTALINFTTTNINPANISTYFWDFGNGQTITGGSVNAASNYINSGAYTVQLITTDINGCRDTIIKTNYIRINGPVAGFNPVNAAGCSGLTTTFTDLSTTDGVNALTNWQWNFGDGNVQSYAAPPFQHTYSVVGTFSVQLIVTDAAGCKDSITLQNAIVTTDPAPNFVTADTLTCPGATVTFTNTSTPSGLTSYWEFGDGGSSTIYSPTHSYTSTGTYIVKLIVTDIYGCADSLIRDLYINVDLPGAAFAVNDSISSCLPFEVQFTNTSTYYNASFWVFGDGGTSSATNPVHYYSTPGTYTVKLIVASPGGCLDSVTHNIYVYDTAGTRVDYQPFTGCKPLSVTLNTFTTGPMNSYFWDFGDGFTIDTTSPNVTHIYASPGNYLPKVILKDPAGCIIPLQGIDTVIVSGALAKFGYNDSVFCDRGLVNFTDSTIFNDPVVSYNWTFGDGGTSAIQNPSYFYANPGLYTVRLIVQTLRGCSDTLVKPTLIRVVQRPLIDIGGDSVVCVFGRITHSGIFIQPDTSIVTWQWNFPNGVTSLVQNPPAQAYNTVGSFTITTYATNSTGCADTTTQRVYVNPLATVTIPAQMTITNGFPETIPATYTPNTINWIWSPSAGLSCITCPMPEAGPKINTNYQVYFTDVNGCANRGSIMVYVLCKNANLFMPNTFSPNGDGSNDVFYPRGRGLERVKMLRIFNRWGEVVFEKANFPVNDISSGWNGTYTGQKPKADVYVYQVDVFCENGETIRLDGNIALIL